MKISEIIRWAKDQEYQFEFIGDETAKIEGFSSLSHYRPGTITWIKKHVPEDDELIHSIQCAVIQKGLKANLANTIISDNSKELFFAILAEFFGGKKHIGGKRAGTYIGDNVFLDEPVEIGCNCVLDGDIHIGKGTVIEHNVVIMNKVTIGENCIIHSGTVIGKDGFGYSFDKENLPVKVKHFGGVLIGNRVEIGANCTVDRGTIDNTVVGDDVKIDNLVLIAHNAEVGRGTIVVGCTDLAGSSHIGEKTYIGPQVCVKNQVSVGDNSFVGMDVMVTESFGDNMMLIKSSSDKPRRNRNYRRFL